MRESWVDVPTAAGACDTFVVRPDGDGPWPAAVMYSDAGGLKPAYFPMARRLAANGYVTLLPNLFYREYRAEHGLPETNPERLTKIVGDAGLSRAMVADDAAGLLAYVDAQPDVIRGKVGFAGYCLGGSCAVAVAARYPDRAGAALSFHGARFHYDNPDSVHLVAGAIRCPVFIGMAAKDPYVMPGEMARFQPFLDQAGVPNRFETFPATGHGFGILGNPWSRRDAYERAWARIIEYFGDNLPGP